MKRIIVADSIIVDVNQQSVQADYSFVAAKCQVHLEIDPDGNMSDPSCDSVSCGGSCDLMSEETGSGTKYWCDCT